MTTNQKRFFLSAVILLIFVVALSQILFSTIFVTKNFPARTISIVLVWMVTCLFHYWMMKIVTDKPKSFNRIFMLQTTLKLLLYSACIAGYLFFFREYGVPFTMHFFVVYLIFAIFDVSLILKFVRENTGQVPGSIKKTN